MINKQELGFQNQTDNLKTLKEKIRLKTRNRFQAIPRSIYLLLYNTKERAGILKQKKAQQG